MKNEYVFITSAAWFDGTSLKNPITVTDNKLETYYPNLYCTHYDTRLLATKAPSKEEQASPIYNDYRERYGSDNIIVLDKAINGTPAISVFLNGFNQEQFLYVAPKIMDTAEIIYFFKCPYIHDLSSLSHFKKLKCVHIYWNNSLESLWDMTDNQSLKVISFSAISKLNSIEALKNSAVEYVSLDSSDNNGNKKKISFDTSAFESMPRLKHLSLIYSDSQINY